jgi:methylmalonyl-CoA/ethylmalonyl-CoA epimerase
VDRSRNLFGIEKNGGMASQMKFDHVGVVVPNVAEGREILNGILGIVNWTEIFEDRGMDVYVQFGQGPDGPCYELIAPLSANSPVSVALRTRKSILNHVAYLVPNLDLAATAMRDSGCMPVTEAQPAKAYDGRLVQFFLSPLEFILELIEAPEHRHSFSTIARGAGL